MNRWTKNQKEHAKNQGWGIFAIDGNQDNLVIQKDDEMNMFESDQEALEFVIGKAKEKDFVCALALDMTHVVY